MNWGHWHGCSDCAAGPQPGARALLAWLLGAYGRGESLGIYNCRNVRGAGSLSIHSCGRALDFDPDGTRGGRGAASFAVGREIVGRLGEHGNRLGVQAVIYNRTIWSRVSPGGRAYGGVHPHDDHLHIELTPTAASRLTLATLRSVLSGESRAVAVGAKRRPDTVIAAMLGDAHGFAAVTPHGDRWMQHYPPNDKGVRRTAVVDEVDYLVGVGFEADELVARAGDGFAVTAPNAEATGVAAVPLIRDRDVPRTRPWPQRAGG